MIHLIKYLRHPAFTAEHWTTRNPRLLSGEVGYVLENNQVVACKVGPGLWNDLPYFLGDIYPYDEVVSNPIGDASGNLIGKRSSEILRLMLNPYSAPAFSNVLNNANGPYQANPIREIGNALSGSVVVTFSLSNQDNLVGGTPISVNAGGIFSNEGNFIVGPISLNLVAPLNPGGLQTYTINLVATHEKGTVNTQSRIAFYPKAMWASSPQESLTAVQFMALSKSTRLTNNFRGDYSFGGNGYSWLFLPSMLNPSNLIFTDVTNPNAPAGYGFTGMGTLSVNNGVATYNYSVYRSDFNQISPTILRIS